MSDDPEQPNSNEPKNPAELGDRSGGIDARRVAKFFAERGKNGDPDWAVEFLGGRPE